MNVFLKWYHKTSCVYALFAMLVGGHKQQIVVYACICLNWSKQINYLYLLFMIVVGGPQQFSMYCWKVGLGVYALFCELGRATQQANVLYAAFDI